MRGGKPQSFKSLFNSTIWEEYFPMSGHYLPLSLKKYILKKIGIVTTREPKTLHEIVNYQQKERNKSDLMIMERFEKERIC